MVYIYKTCFFCILNIRSQQPMAHMGRDLYLFHLN